MVLDFHLPGLRDKLKRVGKWRSLPHGVKVAGLVTSPEIEWFAFGVNRVDWRPVSESHFSYLLVHNARFLVFKGIAFHAD